MYGHPLEDIHRLIHTVEDGIRAIDAREHTDTIPVSEMPEITEAVLELLGWTNTAYMQNELGINSALLSKFVKMRGTVPKHDARRQTDGGRKRADWGANRDAILVDNRR